MLTPFPLRCSSGCRYGEEVFPPDEFGGQGSNSAKFG